MNPQETNTQITIKTELDISKTKAIPENKIFHPTC